MRVFVTDDDPARPCVGIHTPPGDVALLDVTHSHRFQQHVAAAMLEAVHRGAQMLADPRYQGVHEILIMNADTRRLGVMATAGHVDFSGAQSWFRLAPDDADVLAESIRSAAAAARVQRRM